MRIGIRSAARRRLESALLARATFVRRTLLALGRDASPGFPEIVQIESTNICNAKCVFCPRDAMSRKQGVMDMALFARIVDESASLGVRHVRLHNYGESFIDRQLVEKVRYAKQRGIAEVGLISNGSLINDGVARGIVEAGLDAMNISVDAAGKETFERTRVGLSYDKVIGNIENLLRVRRELGKTRPKLILSFVRRSDSVEEQQFIDAWRDRVDKVHVTALHNWAGTLHGRADVTFPCYRQWLTFTVLWDGRVALCCADFDGRVILGDMRRQSIREVWNSEPYRRARRAHLESGGPEICRSCDLPLKDSPLWIRRILTRHPTSTALLG
ncbi:MAG: radical SAM/SPASM domain-containing protein [Vicinamibacterales bacterium]